MSREEKIEIFKRCFLALNPEITEEDWQEMTEEDSMKHFLTSVTLAMDTHFNKQASDLLRFIRKDYRPQAPNLREWFDEKRKVIVSEDGVLLSFGLSQGIKKALNK